MLIRKKVVWSLYTIDYFWKMHKYLGICKSSLEAQLRRVRICSSRCGKRLISGEIVRIISDCPRNWKNGTEKQGSQRNVHFQITYEDADKCEPLVWMLSGALGCKAVSSLYRNRWGWEKKARNRRCNFPVRNKSAHYALLQLLSELRKRKGSRNTHA